MQTALLEQTLRSLQARLTHIHQGFYPKEILENLGKSGTYASFLEQKELGLEQAIQSIYAVSKVCGNTGFCVWCQNALAWYLLHSDNKKLFEKASLGEVLGGTGLSNPIKSFARIESVKIKAVKVSGGYVLNGTLPWVSNLDYGHYFGVIAQENENFIFGIVHCVVDKLELQEDVHFIGLEGSGTFAVVLKDYFLEDALVISHSFNAVSQKIMPGFVLMQSGIVLGLLENAIAVLEKYQDSKNGINAYLPYGNLQNIAEIKEQRDKIQQEALYLAKTPYDESESFFHKILELKSKGATLLLEVAQIAMLSAGTKGYLKDSNVSKLLVESYFAAIVTPSLKHINKILGKV
ncbi:acyl-CoA dehydrogenase [Helicobacter sp. MIT 11-5569]|uniref:acyl-CoA dehydrogenase family protein n=1 Tax=Helicobacter sp. MIT 11-5569 TaxID=1548151 RepID=UPI00051F9220|nr:acyl-CoA dehydrogenase family protein [Helicobacter sp. MIT 11-5569]TLD81414.1 acyl-CoA dehydrogenase [Helicobacter sp. MIT 11-5569]